MFKKATRNRSVLRAALAALTAVAVALVLAACGSDDDNGSTAA